MECRAPPPRSQKLGRLLLQCTYSRCVLFLVSLVRWFRVSESISASSVDLLAALRNEALTALRAVAPSAVVIRGPVHQSVSEHRQRNPRRQRKGARVVEFILRTLVFLLPTAIPRRIAQVPPFPKEKRKGLLIA